VPGAEDAPQLQELPPLRILNPLDGTIRDVVEPPQRTWDEYIRRSLWTTGLPERTIDPVPNPDGTIIVRETWFSNPAVEQAPNPERDEDEPGEEMPF